MSDDKYVASIRDAAIAYAAAGQLPFVYVRKIVELVEADCEYGMVSANLLEAAADRIDALETALTEAISIVSGGNNPDSARNRKADEWRAILKER